MNVVAFVIIVVVFIVVLFVVVVSIVIEKVQWTGPKHKLDKRDKTRNDVRGDVRGGSGSGWRKRLKIAAVDADWRKRQ